MNVLSPTGGYLFLLVFGLAMLGLTLAFSRGKQWQSQVGFLAAGRRVSWWIGAPSIAASWIWAPALFVSVQKAYELGVPGIFWFTAPNIVALAIFAFLAPQIRSRLPGGYTLPDWILYRLEDRTVHKLYLVPYLSYQIMAVCVQLFVGGMMIEFMTGIPLNVVMVLLCVIALSYSLVSGLRASIITDFIQISMIFIVGIIIIPWTVTAAGGWSSVSAGLGGLAGKTSILDPEIAFSFGIVTSIGLIAGSISDQQYWQRSFAIRTGDLVKSFVIGSLLFGIVPIALSILGFLGANTALGISLPEGTGLPMIGVAAVAKVLPAWATVLFVLMLLSGLTSTLDSGLCAASSLYAIDMAKLSDLEADVLRKERLGKTDFTVPEQDGKERLDSRILTRSRFAIIATALIGLGLALVVQYLFSLDRLWWIFNGVASCFIVPTLLSLYWKRLSARGVFWGIIVALFGMVFFVYGNWIKDDVITVLSAVFIVLASLVACLLFPREEAWVPHEVAAEEGASEQ